MKPDRPLILSILLLAGGLILIFGYANGTAGLSAALPVSNSTLHIDVNTTGPAALSGIALLGLGVLFLLWALLGALVSQLTGSYREPERLLSRRRFEDEEDYADRTPTPRASFLGLESAAPLPRSSRFEQQDSRS